MRRILIAVLLSGVPVLFPLAQAGSQQTPPSQATPSAGTEHIQIAPGSVIPVVLTRPIDAKKAKTGDPVEARVAQDLKANDGAIILAKDAKVTGHVNSAQPRSKEQKESQVSVVFDRVQMKGTDTPLLMSIQAVVFPVAADGGGGSGVSSAPPGGSMANDTTPGGRPSGMSMPSAGGSDGSGSSQPATRMPPITGETQGVVGNANLKLAADAQGSVISSEKGNVKVEPGTLMLLRVSQ